MNIYLYATDPGGQVTYRYNYNEPEIDLSNKQLLTITGDFDKFTELETLNLSHNLLNYMPFKLFKCKKLKILDLSVNQLNILPSEIRDLDLTELDLSDNHLMILPGVPRTLKTLLVTRNPLGDCLEQISNLVNLETLWLPQTQLKKLSPMIGQLTMLKELNLYANMLTELPDELWTLQNLELLVLSLNNIKKISPKIKNLKLLNSLYLGVCKLTELPIEISELPLKVLKFAGNNIANIQSEILNMSLIEINMAGNRILEFPRAILNMANLRELDASGNNYKIIPIEICKMPITLCVKWSNIIMLPFNTIQIIPSVDIITFNLLVISQ